MYVEQTKFDPHRLIVGHVDRRENLVTIKDVIDPETAKRPKVPMETLLNITRLAGEIKGARDRGKPVILFMGGHPLKLGLQTYINWMIEEGWITAVAGTGATLFHDFEMGVYGFTSEPVEKYLPSGEFGMWDSATVLNRLLNRHYDQTQMSLGQVLGPFLGEQERFNEFSIAATAYKCGISLTFHPHLGADVWQMATPFDSRVVGELSYSDFLFFVHQVSLLDQGGVFINLGSRVAGPELFLKALSMARNVAHQDDGKVGEFTTAVFDWDAPLRDEAHESDSPQYYNRAWKTILHRAVAPDGQGIGIPGDFANTIPALWAVLCEEN